jgi:hypothetical protein
LRRVVREKLGKEIIERARELADQSGGRESGGSKGNLDYLPFHPAAWTEICNELDDDVREEYLGLVEKWNNGAVPASVQEK